MVARRVRVVRLPFALLASLVVGAVGCTDREELAVSVTPETALVDEPFDVRVTGAPPGGSVTITITAESERGATWSLTREARADDAGGVVLPDEYVLAELRPSGDAPDDDYLRPPFSLDVTARAGDERAETTVGRVVEPDGVEITELLVEPDGFRARWWVPGEGARRTAILLLGGSEGGLSSGLTSGVLAGHGYHVLQLAYFSEEGLPDELLRIPLEYFRTALDWLHARDEIDGGTVVVQGVSRGGELALLLGTTYAELLDAVVAYVPSASVFPAIVDQSQPAWTLRGRGVPSELIPVERIRGPVFLVGGRADALWPSGVSVDLIAEQLRQNGRRDVVALNYDDAGHGVGRVVPNTYTPTVVRTRYGELSGGGSPEADEAAREDSWPKLLRFLDDLD